MKHWVLKTEPESYSLSDLSRDKKTRWDGVRNYQARNNLRSMEVGDVAVIYESVGPKAAVGVAKVVQTAYQDPKTKEDWSAVDIAFVTAFDKPVTLSQMKADKTLKSMLLVRQSRLSVSPISVEEFKRLLELSQK